MNLRLAPVPQSRVPEGKVRDHGARSDGCAVEIGAGQCDLTVDATSRVWWPVDHSTKARLTGKSGLVGSRFALGSFALVRKRGAERNSRSQSSWKPVTADLFGDACFFQPREIELHLIIAFKVKQPFTCKRQTEIRALSAQPGSHFAGFIHPLQAAERDDSM